LASTSRHNASAELLTYCLSGEAWPDALLRDAIAEDEGRALLRIVVERLAALFEPVLCETYAHLFSRVIEILHPERSAEMLLDRYRQVRQPRVCRHDPGIVYVLSRVTLGADVAVTSIVLDAMKLRYPRAAIVFVGARKNYDLFAADPRIQLHEFQYPRASGLADRIRAVPDLRAPGSIVVDPDSRLTQLGLLPVCAYENYFFFESRSYGGVSDESLWSLTRRWLSETFAIDDARAFIAPAAEGLDAGIAVSLGVGENQEKRLDDDFEAELIRMLAATGAQVVIDEGAGGEERERVRRLAHTMPSIQTLSGAYAPFARTISRAKLYVGYDSAGQHVAAACGVPLISIFAGYPSDRMFARWRPVGPGKITVIKVDRRDPSCGLGRVAGSLQNCTL
jgi:ADP-heptose:LPS heptosyltransferase